MQSLFKLFLCVAAVGVALAGPQALRDAVCSETPTQLHLSFVHGPTSMAVSWSNRCVKAEHAHLLKSNERVAVKRRRLEAGFSVKYWEKGNEEQVRSVPATTKRYFLSYHHSAVMTELRPATEYCYKVANSDSGGCFRTEDPVENPTSFTFASIGDMGTNNSAQTIQGIFDRREDIAFVVHGGDIGYGDDLGFPSFDPHRPAHLRTGPFGYEIVYDDFMDKIAPIAQRIPYMVVPGNHDVSCDILTDLPCDPGQRNFSAYRARFRMPSEESGAGPVESMWYSFEYKNVHFTMIDTESDYPMAPTQPWVRFLGGRGGGFGDQLTWLEKDLAKARASKHIDWVIVVGHRQIYSSRVVDMPFGIGETLRGILEPLFVKYSVDLYIGAHVHNYEHTFPMKGDKRCDAGEKCTVYVVNGAGGNCEDAEGPGNYQYPVEHGAYHRTGFGVVSVKNSTHLNWKFIITSKGEVGQVGDDFWVHSTKFFTSN